MKRHETLAPLSREHHAALILAQLLKINAPAYKGLPENTEDKAVYAANFYIENLQKHFLQEEILLEKVKEYHNEIKKLAAEIINEHQQLKIIFTSLDKSENLAATLDVLGRALENHIRKEERVLFPLIQKHCPEDIMNGIVL